MMEVILRLSVLQWVTLVHGCLLFWWCQCIQMNIGASSDGSMLTRNRRASTALVSWVFAITGLFGCEITDAFSMRVIEFLLVGITYPTLVRLYDTSPHRGDGVVARVMGACETVAERARHRMAALARLTLARRVMP